MNPPYMDEGDPNFNAAGMGFSDKTIRAGFIRRVYSILSVSKLLISLFPLLRKQKKIMNSLENNKQTIHFL